MRIRALGPEDIGLLLSVEPGLFDNPVRPEAARAFLDNPFNEMVVALDRRRMVAFASATVLQHPDKAPTLFVNEVGTRESHQQRGLATSVCLALFDRARARGCKGIWLATEPDNDPALALYRRLGGAEFAFVGFGWDGAFEGD